MSSMMRSGSSDRGLSLELTDATMQAMADEGYDPQFGARPLKRVIQQRLENAIASRILSGEFQPGDTIRVGYEGKSYTFDAQRNNSDEPVMSDAGA